MKCLGETRDKTGRRVHAWCLMTNHFHLAVNPEGGLGPLCHYLHLNPVCARLRPVAALADWPWSSMAWLMNPAQRPAWFDPSAALAHADNLADTRAGRRQYLEYLAWLTEDEPAKKELHFAEMSKGWLIGYEPE